MKLQSKSLNTRNGIRTLALASALCCASLAQAQVPPPGVTLYGLVDVGVTSVSGLRGGTQTQIASGVMEGSRWGIKGNEDLGGGYKAIFTLESRIEADTGANSSRPISGLQVPDRYTDLKLLGLPGALQPVINQVAERLAEGAVGVNVGPPPFVSRVFDRQLFVGLITPVGAFLAGRMYTPAYETNYYYDIMKIESALGAAQIAAFPSALEIRLSNSVAYRIVKGGVSGALMYSYGDAGEAAGNKGRFAGINAKYDTGGFSVGAAYNDFHNELGQQSLTSAVFGASMELGNDKVSGMVIKIKDKNPKVISSLANELTGLVGPAAALTIQNALVDAFRQDGTLYHIGYRHVIDRNTFTVAYNAYNDTRPANSDIESYGAAYTYAFSKSTDVSAVVVRFNNHNFSQLAPGGNGFLGGVTRSAGTDSNSVSFSIRHRF